MTYVENFWLNVSDSEYGFNVGVVTVMVILTTETSTILHLLYYQDVLSKHHVVPM